MTEPIPHILVVDDHRDIREPLARYLDKAGYRTSMAADAKAARAALRDGAIDLVVLDIMMPGEDGLSLCRDLVGRGAGPAIVLLTAMGEDTDRIVGLEMGADDYVVKPFNPRELLARIKAVLRRGERSAPRPGPAEPGRVGFQGWVLDLAKRELLDPEGVLVPLTGGEYALLAALATRPGRVLNRDRLLDLTRGRDIEAFDRSIDNAISRLRRKLGDDAKQPRFIKTVWGGGYVFVAEPEALG